jgi:hypothetical protein
LINYCHITAETTTQPNELVSVLTSPPIKTEITKHSTSTELWTQPNIDLDLSALNNQTTLEIDFSESQNFYFPISKQYFASKNQQELSDILEFQNVKIEISDNEIEPLENFDSIANN